MNANKLPSTWTEQTLSESAEIVMGQSPPGSSYNESGEGRPFFQGKAEFGHLYPTVRKWTTAGNKFARAGDILLSVRAPVGPTNLADVDCVIGRGLAAIRAKSHVNQTFLLWFLRSFESEIAAKGTGTTFDSISGDSLRRQRIAVPPLDEQEVIVGILEEQLSRLDAATAAIEAVRTKAARFRRSLLNAAFTGALTCHEGSPEGEIPSSWVESQLGEIADVGWGDLQVTKASYVDDGFVAYSASGPDGFRDVFDFDEDGIVLSAIGARCGKTWFARGQWSCIKNTIRILEKSPDVRLDFLYQQLSDPEVWPKRGTGQPFISQKDARELMVKVPPLHEQVRIVEILEEQISRLDATLGVSELADERVAKLRRSLLHAAFTGLLTKEWRESAHV